MTRKVLVSQQNDSYIIDENGTIPGINFSTNSGEYLVICPLISFINFKEKIMIIGVEELFKNEFVNKWIPFISGKFLKNELGSYLLISNENLVNATTGNNALPEDTNTIGEFDFYIKMVGIPVIFTGIQGEFLSRFGLTVDL